MRIASIVSASLSVMVLIGGLLFMVHDLPYGNYVLAVSLLLLGITLVITYNLDKKMMYIAGAIFCVLPIMGLTFTQLNLPGAKLLLTVGLIFFAIFFVPWFAFKCFKR